MSATAPSKNNDVIVVSKRLVLRIKRSIKRDDGSKTCHVSAMKRVTKDKSKAFVKEDNEDKKVTDRWMDEHVVALNSFCGEMNEEFNRNLKK